MKINKDGELQINVPYHTEHQEVENFIHTKYSWILKKKDQYINKLKHKEPQFIDGEIHFYLGKSYPLILITSTISQVNLLPESIAVFHRKNASIKNIYIKWLSKTALTYFVKRTKELASLNGFSHIKDIKVRYMKARWGSCSSDKVLTFNVHLIKYEPQYIDYVIIHELCHLIHLNHGKQFYQLQSKLNPDWKSHRLFLSNSPQL